jgi:pyroglutamyl-peptidase
MALLRAARMSGAPAALSQDAGRYVCNALFWRALEASRRGGPMLIAFVHVPRLRPGFGFTKLARAGEAILAEILAAARRPR